MYEPQQSLQEMGMLRGMRGARGCLVLMQRVGLEGSWDKTPTAPQSQGKENIASLLPF